MSLKILIVEDNILIATDLKDRLEDFGYSVSAIVADASIAIRKSLDMKPGLIIMDIMLKGEMNGIEAAREIHKVFPIPVVYLTGNSHLLIESKPPIPFGFVNKPFTDVELQTAIQSLIKRNKNFIK